MTPYWGSHPTTNEENKRKTAIGGRFRELVAKGLKFDAAWKQANVEMGINVETGEYAGEPEDAAPPPPTSPSKPPTSPSIPPSHAQLPPETDLTDDINSAIEGIQ